MSLKSRGISSPFGGIIFEVCELVFDSALCSTKSFLIIKLIFKKSFKQELTFPVGIMLFGGYFFFFFKE